MASILCIETSSNTCSVAFFVDGLQQSLGQVNVPQTASSVLGQLVKDVLAHANAEPSMVSAVAVSSGPGSYTGLRIGTALAKGLCYTLDIPLIAINTLQLMTASLDSRLSRMMSVVKMSSQEFLFCPMIDAGRMEVYCQLFDSELKPVGSTEAKIIDEESFQTELSHSKLLFFGSGSDKCQSLIQHENALFLGDLAPSASDMGKLAMSKFDIHEFEDTADFEPTYLKEFRVKKPKMV